jgi:light-regulated signal transduction histidine kinase (bacteriophytochrome)
MTRLPDSPLPFKREPGGDADEGLELGVVQVVDIVAGVVHKLDGAGKRIQLVMERAPTVVADSEKLAEVTSSLLKDALEASSDAGPIEVEVSATCLAPDHDGGEPNESEREACNALVSVAVRDRSPDSGEHHEIEGVLRNAHKILQLHKGRLWFAAETKQGRTAGYCLNSERAA